jgi:hypothetical protein
MNAKHWTDEDLMAYADEQLAGEARAQLATAIAADAGLRQRVEALASQRRRVAAAFADVLDEPVPDRLSALLAIPASAPSQSAVTDLAAARERRAAARRPGLSWAHWGGMAASVALGVVLGLQMGSRGGGDGDALLSEADGQMVAGARLAQALGTQVAGQAGNASGVAVQLSFVAKDGRYCRTFSTERVAGLACRDMAQWAVQTTVAADGAASAGAPGLRQAASELPRAVLEAVDARIEGAALTAEQELGARQKGWRP